MADPTSTQSEGDTPPGPQGPPPGGGKSLTIGAVCKALSQEFPDISISKIRYLEDQKLLQPRRTPGGYRLYSSTDVSRLRTILRMQRDEFLPLRVIRQELAAGRTTDDEVPAPRPPARRPGDARPGAALRRLTFSIRSGGALYSLEDVVDETGADPRLVSELEDYGIVKGEQRGGTGRPEVLRRDRARDRPRRHRAVALRRGGAQPARVPHLAPSARPRCCSRSSPRRCARAIPSGARRPSRRWRTSPPSRRTSSTCCWCATCAGSPSERRVAAGHIRDIPDFPKPGIVFKDITPLLLDPPALDEAVRQLADWARPREIDLVLAAEARGFILGAALARELGVGFVPARKPGKLPHDTVSAEYILEYGVDALEMHADALADGARVLLHDDLLATGGTARALAELAEGAGARDRGLRVPGRARVPRRARQARGYDVHALISYDAE